MDNNSSLPYREVKFDFVKTINIIARFFILFLVLYLVFIIKKRGDDEAILVFKGLRNQVYLVLTLAFVLQGIKLSIDRRKGDKLSIDLYKRMYPPLVISLVITTFSYAIALLIYNLLSMVGIY